MNGLQEIKKIRLYAQNVKALTGINQEKTIKNETYKMELTIQQKAKNSYFKKKIKEVLRKGKPQDMSLTEWLEYKKWANKKLKSKNPYGFGNKLEDKIKKEKEK